MKGTTATKTPGRSTFLTFGGRSGAPVGRCGACRHCSIDDVEFAQVAQKQGCQQDLGVNQFGALHRNNCSEQTVKKEKQKNKLPKNKTDLFGVEIFSIFSDIVCFMFFVVPWLLWAPHCCHDGTWKIVHNRKKKYGREE